MKHNILLLKAVVTIMIMLALVISFPTKALATPVTGAIYTTDSTCTGIDLNIYASKMDVYLDGGPAHPNGNGLPNGSYYVQVTNPDGTLLGTSGTTTPAQVVNGEFADCYQLWSLVMKASNPTLQGYDDSTNSGGEYKVWVSQDPTFVNSTTKTDNFKVKQSSPNPSGSPIPGVSPSPIPSPETARLQVEKFYDANANGIKDTAEQLITGWKVRIVDGMEWIRYTLVDMIVEPDTYTVTEFMPIETNWLGTTTNPVITTLNAGDEKLVSFGNVCIGTGGGKTKGYWSNKNGQATMNDGGTMEPELLMLRDLNLRSYNGSHFDPTTYAQFRTWLTSANATNMAYMLSAQLSAMELNVESGMVSGTALIYAPELLPYAPITGLNSLGYIRVNDLMSAANLDLFSNGSTLDGSPFRAYQEALKNVLDKGNNNSGFVQATPCPFTFE